MQYLICPKNIGSQIQYIPKSCYVLMVLWHLDSHILTPCLISSTTHTDKKNHNWLHAQIRIKVLIYSAEMPYSGSITHHWKCTNLIKRNCYTKTCVLARIELANHVKHVCKQINKCLNNQLQWIPVNPLTVRPFGVLYSTHYIRQSIDWNTLKLHTCTYEFVCYGPANTSGMFLFTYH